MKKQPKKICQINEFLAELSDFEKDYEKVFESYNKYYYFYLKRFIINNPLNDIIKKRKNFMRKREMNKRG